MHDYDDIINIKHFEPKHERMSIYNRSAQFAPFSALVGYDDEIKEKARLTDKKIILDDSQKIIINNMILNLKPDEEVIITYFIKDLKKEGGCYKSIKNSIKDIDYVNRIIRLKDKKKIPIDDIIEVKFE